MLLDTGPSRWSYFLKYLIKVGIRWHTKSFVFLPFLLKFLDIHLYKIDKVFNVV